MRKFYLFQEGQTLSAELTWSHYIELLSIKDENKLIYYLNVSVSENLSVRELREKIKSNEYERLPDNTKNKLINEKETNVKDLIPNLIIIKNKNNIEVITEKLLHQLILEDIPSFLKELGTGFTFIDSEYKIKLGDNIIISIYYYLIMNLIVM